MATLTDHLDDAKVLRGKYPPGSDQALGAYLQATRIVDRTIPVLRHRRITHGAAALGALAKTG